MKPARHPTTARRAAALASLFSLALRFVRRGQLRVKSVHQTDLTPGKDPDPSAAIVDSQSIKTTEEGDASNIYDAHKNVKGRKRHLLVDTLGLPLSVYVTPADVQDGPGRASYSLGLSRWCPAS